MVTLVSRPKIEALPARPRRHEAGLARTAIEVPFTDEARAVAGVAKNLREGRLGFAETEIVRDHSVDLRISAGEQDRARWAAHGDVGVGAFKPDTLAC